MTSKVLKFLRNIKSDIESLPWAIWEDEDVHDPNYDVKRKNLYGRVMHIQNRTRAFVLKKYGEGELSKEFASYSFFTKGYIANTFNDVNNEAWCKGKKSYLYFIGKLIDFEEAEEQITSTDWPRLITKWIVLILVGITAGFVLFYNPIQSQLEPHIGEVAVKLKMQILLCVIITTANLLWTKHWRELLPLTTSAIGAVVGMNV